MVWTVLAGWHCFLDFAGVLMIWNRSDMHLTSGEIQRRSCSRSVKSRSEIFEHHDVLGSEYLGVLCRYLREEGELACLCLVSALVIQPVLLRSVSRRFVHATGCGEHLFVICIPHGVFFRKNIIIIIIIIIIIEK